MLCTSAKPRPLRPSAGYQICTLHKDVVGPLLIPVVLSRSPVVQALSDQSHHVGLRCGEKKPAGEATEGESKVQMMSIKKYKSGKSKAIPSCAVYEHLNIKISRHMRS
jgi:hypothetical protein